MPILSGSARSRPLYAPIPSVNTWLLSYTPATAEPSAEQLADYNSPRQTSLAG